MLSGYTFVKIADSVTYSGLGVPALGGSGEVAFKGATSTDNLVLKGSGGAVTTIESSAGPLFQFGDPVINASGHVAFWAAADDPGLQSIQVGNGVGSSTMLVQGSAAAQTGEFEQLDRRPDINDDGDLAFMGDTPETTGVFHRSVAGVVTTLAQESDGYLAFPVGETFVSLNNADGVSFNAKLTNGDKALVRHTGTRTNLRDSSGPLDAFTRSSISQDGDVATSVISDLGVHELTLLSGNADPVGGTVLVGAAGPFHQFDAPNLTDNNGGIVLFGLLDTGAFGIYTGADPVANKVIENGDSLDGKSVQAIVFSTNGANSLGQIAFLATFTDGSTAVFRADPQTPQPTTTFLSVPPITTEGAPVTLTATVTTATQNGDTQSGGTPTGNVTFFSVRDVARIALGSDAGFAPNVKVLDGTGKSRGSFAPYPTTFQGGVRVALGDVTGDGVAELITAPGPGGDSIVSIFSMSSGGDGSELEFIGAEHIAITDPLIGTRGLQVAAGDVNGDGFADIIASGGPLVFVYSGADFSQLHRLTPFGTSISEIRVALGDVNGDGVPDLITASGPNAAPSIKIFNPLNGGLLRTIAPFETTFRGGVNVAVGDVTGDGVVEILAAKGPGSTPQVKVFDSEGTLLSSFMPFATNFLGGVRPTLGDLNGDGVAELLLTPGAGGTGLLVLLHARTNAVAAIDSLRTLVSSQAMFYQGDQDEEGDQEYPSGFDPDPAEFLGLGFISMTRSLEETNLGTAPLDTNGVATFQTDDLPSGVISIAARYVGSAAHQISVAGREFIFVQTEMDFGDAPNSYGTRLGDDGARHRITADGPKLGTNRDAETDGKPSANATGDDLANLDDEDGVTFLSPTLFRSNDLSLYSSVIVEASGPGFLDAFIDFNRDGRFSPNSERIIRSRPVVAGKNVFSFNVPGDFEGGIFESDVTGYSVAGPTFARFRISSTSGLGPTGAAEDGEVEDYPITIRDVAGGSGSGGDSAPMQIQLPSQSAPGSAGFSAFDIFVSGDLLTLAGFSSGGDRSPLFQMPFDGRQRIEIMGTPGDDLLRLDLSGSDVSVQDFHFDGGGEATAAGDSLVIIGGGRKFDHWNMTYTDAKDGTISLDGSTIEFKDLEPMDMGTIVDHLTISFAVGDPIRPNVTAALVDRIGGAVSFTGYLSAANDANLLPFETLNFAKPRLSMTLSLGAGDDRLSIELLPGGFDRASLTIRGKEGADQIRAVASIGGLPLNTPVTLDGGAGNDTLVGGNRSDLLIGGNGDDSLSGGDGHDELRGDGGRDSLEGGNGDDSLSGGEDADSLFGGSGNDRLEGDHGDDSLNGGEGNDQAFGGDGSDRIDGQSGNDSLEGGTGADYLEGGIGNDVLNDEDGAEANSDTLTGNAGDDTIHASRGADLLYGGSGNDHLDGGLHYDQVYGEGGNDVLSEGVESSSDALIGGDGDDWISGGGGDDLLSGDSGNDTLTGGEGADNLNGHDGDDRLSGDSGNDFLSGWDGNDSVIGGTGDDSIDGGGDRDSLSGGDGDDSIFGGDGADTIAGNFNNDTILAGDGDDCVTGNEGLDSIAGGDGRDSIDGGQHDDTVTGDEDDDTITGGAGDDLVFGNSGDDSLTGGDGNDLVEGGDDDDLVRGGLGNDTVRGQDGSDRVQGQAGHDRVNGGDGLDAIDGGAGTDVIEATSHRITITRTRLTSANADDENEIETLAGIELALLEGSPTVDTGSNLNASGFLGSVTLIGSIFSDSLTGSGRADSIDGLAGNDSIIAGAGADTIDGGSDFDTINAGDGNDSISGGDGNDMLFGERGRDTISGGGGNDSIEGDIKTDSVVGTFGNDSLLGDAGNDTIRGGFGDDVLKGGADNDQLFGDRGHDLLNGGSGNDVLEGDIATDTALAVAGNDSLTGQDGDDTLRGFGGNDVLVGGNGKDSLDGGAGKDTLLGEADNDTLVGGADVDVLAGGAGINVITAPVAGEINEAFTFPGGHPAWIDEI